MRTLLLLLFLSCICSSLRAQDIIFSKSLSETDIPASARIRSSQKTHYAQTWYAQQSSFLDKSDFLLALGPGHVFHARLQQVQEYPAGSTAYSGKLEGGLSGDISFSKYKDRIAGMAVLTDGRKFMIDQTAEDIYAISLSDDNQFNEMDKRPDFIELPEETMNGVTSICDINSTCVSPSVIDIMVVYTAQAASAWGGVNATVANITQAVSNMTASMSNTGINNVSFRLVHTAQVSYSESGSFSTDLSRLAGTSDGYMDNVHSLRNQYGADLVCLIIGSPTSSCGIGYLNTSPTAYSSGSGFNVTLYSCAVGNYTMAHECGHNMGLRHDWYMDGSTTPCSHHHGYVNQAAVSQGTSSPASARWRTIMAYNNQCTDAGFSCTRLNRWSNPQLSYNGDPTGRSIGLSQPSDEAYAFYRMACLVAAFRPEASSTCPSPADLSSTSIGTNTATVSWGAVTGALSYDMDYKPATSGTWINAASAVTGLSVTLTGLSAGTLYDWRVRTNCSGLSSTFSTAQFTTTVVLLCPGSYDISTNGNTVGAATIPLNTDIKGLINPKNDIDFYGFTVSTGGSINLTLSSLPANYNLALLNSNGTQLAKSEKNGTNDEVITATVVAGTYFARVYPKGNATHASLCYNLRIQTGTAADIQEFNGLTLSLFPNPAGDELQVQVSGITSKGTIRVLDIQGRQVLQQPALNRLNRLDLRSIPAGLYLLQVQDGTLIQSRKFIHR